MIKYKDKNKFEDYKNKLLKYINKNDGSYIEFMRKSGNPFNYLKELRTIDFAYSNLNLQSQYYDEINIDEITSANADSILDNNFIRVIDAIDYILENKCEPISLIKFKDGYYIKDGKHRYFAHVLLGKNKIPASILRTDGIDNTGSYWEGISIEGRALSNLIIFRLPFPVPEPIIDYKRSISKDGLMEVNVPEMIIKLKQGIGRLIRNKNDFGIVSIIDPRLGDSSNVPYKQLAWDALPIKNKSNDIEEVKAFYSDLTSKTLEGDRLVTI